MVHVRSASESFEDPGWGSGGGAVDACLQPVDPSPDLINEDLRPVDACKRTFTGLDFLGLWVGLVVNIPSYYLAGSLVDLGMSWWQAVLTVTIGNAIVLIPMLLNGYPGTKYGIPFPVLVRSSFGIRGAHIAALLRGLVACGWFGIQTWIGADAISQLFIKIAPALGELSPLPVLDITSLQFSCYIFFWLAQVLILLKGMESIRFVERLAAPVLLLMSAALAIWAIKAAGGLSPLLSKRSQFGPGMPLAGQFWEKFWPSLTANVGFWATLGLNIPDFTRYAKTQRGQIIGQAIGLPGFMALFSLVGVVVTSSTETIFGEVITNPVEVLARLDGYLPSIMGLLGVIVATVSTNLAANIVGPANALVNLVPKRISFTFGAVITSILGAAPLPWKLISSTKGFVYTWLIGYSALLGPLIGIFLADYYLVQACRLDIDALYSMGPHGKYWYKGGYNIAALLALCLGAIPSFPGFLHAAGAVRDLPSGFIDIYNSAWFVGLAIGGVIYFSIMKAFSSRPGFVYSEVQQT